MDNPEISATLDTRHTLRKQAFNTTKKSKKMGQSGPTKKMRG